MANAFTKTKATRFGGHAGKSFLLVEGTLVIDTTASGGAAAGDLLVSMFDANSQRIISAAIVNDDNSKNWVGTPAYNGGSLLVVGGASNAPMDLPNDTYAISLVLQ